MQDRTRTMSFSVGLRETGNNTRANLIQLVQEKVSISSDFHATALKETLMVIFKNPEVLNTLVK